MYKFDIYYINGQIFSYLFQNNELRKIKDTFEHILDSTVRIICYKIVNNQIVYRDIIGNKYSLDFLINNYEREQLYKWISNEYRLYL